MWTLKQKRQLQRQRQSTSAACCNPIHAESARAKQKHAPTPCGHSTNLSYSCPTHISDSQHLRQSKTVTHIMWTPMWTLSCLMKTKTVTHWHRLNTEDDPNKSENHHQLDTHSFLDAKRKRIKSPLDLKSFWTLFFWPLWHLEHLGRAGGVTGYPKYFHTVYHLDVRGGGQALHPAGEEAGHHKHSYKVKEERLD